MAATLTIPVPDGVSVGDWVLDRRRARELRRSTALGVIGAFVVVVAFAIGGIAIRAAGDDGPGWTITSTSGSSAAPTVSDVSAEGALFTGRGTALVITTKLFQPGEHVTVLGAGEPRVAFADGEGRLYFMVDMNHPFSFPAQPGNGSGVPQARVTFLPVPPS